jgi:hypothetical protein
MDRLFQIEGDKEASTRTLNNMAAISELFKSGMGNSGQTLWHMYNGVTEFADHHRNIRSTTNRFESAVFGSGYAMKERAFDIACDLAKVNG